jgi:hypothetical protein
VASCLPVLGFYSGFFIDCHRWLAVLYAAFFMFRRSLTKIAGNQVC